jgi:hypothetical protein
VTCVRCQVLRGRKNIKVFLTVTSCSLGDRYQRFEETRCPYVQERRVFLPYCMVAK